MELNTTKILREMKRLGLTYEEIAKKAGLKSRQSAFYLLKSKSIHGAGPFAKALDVDPKDLLK